MSNPNRAAAFLEAADHLERWAESLPDWSAADPEPWYEFLERRYAAEVALIERLRRAPNCQITTCSARMHVELTLGGLSVQTDKGLGPALQQWALLARRRLGKAP
jgi:hypothetical protein